MSLPVNIQLPLLTDFYKADDPDSLRSYNRELIYAIQTMYEDIANELNGTIRSDSQVQRSQWKPVLNGTVSGTFTYTHQVGWVFRRGLLIDVWGDVKWTSPGTASGSLYVELPYAVAVSDEKPFVGVVQSSSITYTTGTGIVINAIPSTTSDSYQAQFWNVGNGIPTGNQSVVSSGQLIFNIRYLGKDDERQ